MFKNDAANTSYHLRRAYLGLLDMLQARQSVQVGDLNVRLSNVYDLTEMLRMAVKKPGKEPEKKAVFVGFYNYDMTQEEKDACKQWLKRDEEIAIGIQDAVASRYKLSVSLDSKGVGYQASMQCNDPKSPNAGLCMSAYAPDWYTALGVLIFKHEVCLQKLWNQEKDDRQLDAFG